MNCDQLPLKGECCKSLYWMQDQWGVVRRCQWVRGGGVVGGGGVRIVGAGTEGERVSGAQGEPIFAQGFTHTDSIVNPTP